VTLGAAVVAPYQLDWYVLTHPFNANVNTEGLSEALGGLILIFAIPAYATVGAVVATLRSKNAEASFISPGCLRGCSKKSMSEYTNKVGA
jgi:hypothetical protein